MPICAPLRRSDQGSRRFRPDQQWGRGAQGQLSGVYLNNTDLRGIDLRDAVLMGRISVAQT